MLQMCMAPQRTTADELIIKPKPKRMGTWLIFDVNETVLSLAPVEAAVNKVS